MDLTLPPGPLPLLTNFSQEREGVPQAGVGEAIINLPLKRFYIKLTVHKVISGIDWKRIHYR